MFQKLLLKILNFIYKKTSNQIVIKNISQIKNNWPTNFWNQLPVFSKIKPVEYSIKNNQKILVLSPHPDDDIFGAGGTLIHAAKLGANITTLYLTHGGSNEEQRVEIEKEIYTVNELLGNKFILWPHRPGTLINSKNIASQLQKILLELKPDLIILPFVLDSHLDHQTTNDLLKEACRGLGTILNLNQIEILAYQIYGLIPASHYINVTSIMANKVELMKIWKNVNGNRNWVHYIKGLNALNSRYISSKDEAYLETFINMPLNEYIKLISLGKPQ